MTEKLRTSKITIETPREDSEPWIHITIQKVIKDDTGKIINVVPRFENISKPLKEFYMEVFPYQDMVLGKEDVISGVGIASALQSSIVEFMKVKYNGKLDSNGDFII